jgi:hypothetical protein
MSEVNRMVAAGNPYGAAERLIMAAQGGIISMDELDKLAQSLGVGDILAYE